MRSLKQFFTIFFVIIFFLSTPMVSWANTDAPLQPLSEVVRGRIISIETPEVDEEKHGSFTTDVQSVLVQVTQGEFRDSEITIDHTLSGNMARDFYYQEGDRVLLWIESTNGEMSRAYIREVTRDHYLMYLTLFFIFSLLLIGGKKGAKAIITLCITGLLVIKVLLPLILEGFNPTIVTIVIASIIVSSTLIIISGFNRKTYAAIIGTIGGVIIAGILASTMTSLTRLTGLSNNEAQTLMYLPQGTRFNFQGLLFSGMIIGAMGAVLDVGMSISSSMDEISRANPSLTTKELIGSGLNIGRDIMGTMSNTLILAYTGASMHLLLVLSAYDVPLSRIMSVEPIATEVIRILSGSIGLIYAIPLTAIAAGFLYNSPALQQKKPIKNKV
ncbi:YibE/F family protein [Alkaliphilus metalliredigens QYMF]|uniref:YibE/F family protein n=1 Tax=Alkaliphilus metalliredigens (strain QYMF) TaxID=293826 RepID=A6TKQ2_ALKMQ|nr:YibE/F family protein [Alkaliphilus metalliredigens]ABR46770.1 YibE/F family protein [Alkaliphilus metalliredigens QYMF]